jgi:hypothetical protein
MAEVDPQTLEALNALLQDERASVEVEVALSNGATERVEREAIVAMGIEEVGFCCSLHEYLAASGAFVTRHVNGIVLTIISTEHYDERLHAFATHQKASGERALQLGAVVGDHELRQLLAQIHQAHEQSALWNENRAAEFASSHLLEFRVSGVGSGSSAEARETRREGEAEATEPPLGGERYGELAEDAAGWSGDSYRPPTARETYPPDDE